MEMYYYVDLADHIYAEAVKHKHEDSKGKTKNT